MKALRYFILSLGILLLDQVSKILVVKYIPLYSKVWSFGGDFFNLIHVRNDGAAFSLGSGLPDLLRIILFIILPLIILGGVAFYVIKGKDLNTSQRWALAGIIGGGLGNQIDRIFRPTGVVDFLDFKFYGIFGWERWPTFNVADSAIVISSLTLCVTYIIQEIKARKQDGLNNE